MADVDPVKVVEKFIVHVTRYDSGTGEGLIVVTECYSDGRLGFFDASAKMSLEDAGMWAEAMLWAWASTGLVGLHAFRESQVKLDLPEAAETALEEGGGPYGPRWRPMP